MGDVPEVQREDRVTEDNRREPWLANFYASCLGRIQQMAREHGYAACLHGSMQRDLDLVMVPWTEDATDVETLIAAMRSTFSIFGEHPPHENDRPKPHGRRCWTVLLGGRAYIDISVMPRSAGGGT